MINIMNNEEIRKEYLQWLKDKDKTKQELVDVFVDVNGEIKTEKKMICIMKNSPEDWREFCEDTGREYKGEIKLLAIC